MLQDAESAVDILYADGTKEKFTQQGGEFRTSVDTILERIQYKKELIEIEEVKRKQKKKPVFTAAFCRCPMQLGAVLEVAIGTTASCCCRLQSRVVVYVLHGNGTNERP